MEDTTIRIRYASKCGEVFFRDQSPTAIKLARCPKCGRGVNGKPLRVREPKPAARGCDARCETSSASGCECRCGGTRHGIAIGRPGA
jgi:hypothetical protein